MKVRKEKRKPVLRKSLQDRMLSAEECTCSVCKETKLIVEFIYQVHTNPRFRTECKTCHNNKCRKRNKASRLAAIAKKKREEESEVYLINLKGIRLKDSTINRFLTNYFHKLGEAS